MLKLSELNINSLYVGDSSIKKAYVGESLIYQEQIEEGYYTIVHIPGQNVQLVGNAEYFDSIIADGQELQSGTVEGPITVSILIDRNVKVKFKKGLTSLKGCFAGCVNMISISDGLFDDFSNVTDFSFCFFDCASMTELPENLFINNVAAITFESCFENCTGLISIPENLFASCVNVTNFDTCFIFCQSMTSQCPIDNDGTPIYNRSDTKEGYITVTNSSGCFIGCENMPDIDTIPDSWK